MKQTLLILKGLPGAGKTTFARKWVAEDPSNRVRVNADDIMHMLGNYVDHIKTNAVFDINNSAVEIMLLNGYSVVIDNTNFYVSKINIPENVTVIEHFIDTDVEECIKRDALRERPVGEAVIRNMYNKYLCE